MGTDTNCANCANSITRRTRRTKRRGLRQLRQLPIGGYRGSWRRELAHKLAHFGNNNMASQDRAHTHTNFVPTGEPVRTKTGAGTWLAL